MARPSPSSVSQTPKDLKNLVKDGYDKIAPKYHAWASPRPTSTRAQYLEKLVSLIPPHADVLELGCGSGIPSTQFLVSKGLAVTASDISSSQIDLAKQHVPGASFLQGDMMALDLPSRSFDAVVAFYSVFHLPREEQGPMLPKMVQWLKPGGYLLFNLGTKEGDVLIEDWMGASMFSASLGIEGNRKMCKEFGKGLEILSDEVAEEEVGRFKEYFHWFMARKE